KLCEARELAASAVRHCRCQITVVVTEVEERRGGTKFFSHEQHWGRRSEQKKLHGSFYRVSRRELQDTVSECAISNLVMVLEERDEGGEREMAAGLSALTRVIFGIIALIGESLAQAAAEMLYRILRVIRVVAIGFAGEEYVNGMVNVVVPLGVVQLRLIIGFATEIASAVVIVFKDEMDMAIAALVLMNRISKFGEDVGSGVVHDGMDCIKA